MPAGCEKIMVIVIKKPRGALSPRATVVFEMLCKRKQKSGLTGWRLANAAPGEFLRHGCNRKNCAEPVAGTVT